MRRWGGEEDVGRMLGGGFGGVWEEVQRHGRSLAGGWQLGN